MHRPQGYSPTKLNTGQPVKAQTRQGRWNPGAGSNPATLSSFSMKYTQLSGEVLDRYLKNPLEDAEVRREAGVPDDQYYTVSVWPLHLAGRLFVDRSRHRVVRSAKISKSVCRHGA